jgi:hypothetical protein
MERQERRSLVVSLLLPLLLLRVMMMLTLKLLEKWRDS